MDDIKPFTSKCLNEKELETVIQTRRIYCRGIGIKFGMKNVPCSRKVEKDK